MATWARTRRGAASMLGLRGRWSAGALALLAAAAGAAGLYAGCANLQDIPLNQCGNGIVELPNNEDCDSHAVGLDGGVDDDAGFACTYCRVQCGDAGACPWGWGCGTDG